MTGHNVDRYLDSSRVIRELEEAEQAHQLDAQGVLDELAQAARHCEAAGNTAQEIADNYMLARAAYFAEVRRRVQKLYHRFEQNWRNTK